MTEQTPTARQTAEQVADPNSPVPQFAAPGWLARRYPSQTRASTAPALQPATTKASAERPAMAAATTSPAAAGHLAWSRTFPADPAQVPQARRFLSAILDGSPAADDAVLCLSEIATNATLHSDSRKPGGQFTVRAQIHDGRLRVEVCDEGGPWTQPVRSRGGQNGRGLLIVAALAAGWGRAGDSESGWRIWFEMNVRMTASSSSEQSRSDHA